MTRPLYKLRTEKLNFNHSDSNAGLWYDKFCDKWENDWSGLGDDGKKEWILQMTKQKVGESSQIDDAIGRQKELIESQKGKVLCFKTSGPFVTGLGRNHPVENGFAWHHTLGVPFLPGSSVKGLVRAWVRDWLNKGESEEYRRIFGDQNELGAGSVIFLDALPTKPIQLKMDIMTPHYSDYYQGNELPGDWMSPIPIPFMVVAEGQTFQFGLIPRKDADTKDCEIAGKWLAEALLKLGAGAKTAVGYGRFEEKMNPSNVEKWIDEKIEPIVMKQKIEMKQALINQAESLAKEWQQIENAAFKEEVRIELEKRYREMKVWDNPTGGMKKAKRIYLASKQATKEAQ